MRKNNLLHIFIHPDEISVLRNNTDISEKLLRKMTDALQQALQKKGSAKRVKVNYSLKELDKVIASIAEQANQSNCPEDVQSILDNIFGRFAEKYNCALAQKRRNSD